MAGKLLWHVTMSLDGFIAGPEDGMDWVFDFATEASDEALAAIASNGAILAGRHWWDVAVEKYDGLAGIYGGQWSGPVFVMTHHVPEPKGGDPVYLSGGLGTAVATALEAAQGKDVVVFGANLAQQLVALGLIDELLVHIVPVFLGSGTRLIEASSVPRTDWKVMTATKSGEILNLKLELRK